ncbi:MAG TPA: DinB family protein [Thermoanaerobaculia bacterium]|nr:DinB family protein [Thermoanaerobaculia bacterium]
MIETLARTPDRVHALLDGVCQGELSRKPAPDVFSLRENVLHLRDIDIEGYEERIAHILDEDHPFLADVDGAKLAIERDYNNQPLAPALQAFAQSRARSMERLIGADLDRTAELEGVGTVTLRSLLERWVEHDAGHLADIEALLAGRVGRTTATAV